MRGLALSLVLAFGAMAGAALPAGTAAAQATHAISDARLGFSARLPGTPVKTVKPGEADALLININTWTVDAGTAAYSVMALEFKPDTFTDVPGDALLGASLDGGINAVSGVETSRRAATLSGLAALEATFTTKVGDQDVIGRLIVAQRGDIIYCVMTLELAGTSDAHYRQMVRDFKLL
jgi:hypothetical protein